MDDINKQMQDARRKSAREQQARVDADMAAKRASAAAEPRADAPAGAGRLVLERRQGEWRYYLGGHRIQGGDAVEVHLNAQAGWVRGNFQWGRRNTTAPSVRVRCTHPDDPSVSLGELDLSLPVDAICRWPTDDPR
jgi:hypothetical protein